MLQEHKTYNLGAGVSSVISNLRSSVLKNTSHGFPFRIVLAIPPYYQLAVANSAEELDYQWKWLENFITENKLLANRNELVDQLKIEVNKMATVEGNTTLILEIIPEEILEYIISLLDINSIAKLSRTCSTFNRICFGNTLWKTLFMKSFKGQDIAHIQGDTNWRQLFIKCVDPFKTSINEIKKRKKNLKFLP